MGCDIHLFTERNRTISDKKKWVSIDHLKLNPYYGEDDSESKYDVVEVYGGRDYNLFSVLADVRNSHDNKFIAEPKEGPTTP